MNEYFNLQLPEQSILQQDLFSEKTWEFLGLTVNQLIVAGALSGAALAVGLDAVAGGASLGAFAALGGVIGAAAAAFKGKDLLTGTRLLGMKLDRQQLQVGPVTNTQLLYILLDRALLYYSHIINWAHGRRNYQDSVRKTGVEEAEKQGYTSGWSKSDRKICGSFFSALQEEDSPLQEQTGEDLTALIQEKLQQISEDTEPDKC